jgi:hypothetical protein
MRFLLVLIHVLHQIKQRYLVSLRNRCLAQVTVVSGIYRKATDGKIQVDYGRLKLCRQLYAYVTATSLPLWDLENFDRWIFVAQSVRMSCSPRSSQLANSGPFVQKFILQQICSLVLDDVFFKMTYRHI